MKTLQLLIVLFVGMLLPTFNSYAQNASDQPSEKKKIRVMLYADGVYKASNVTLGRADKNLELKAFVYPEDNGVQLFIPSLDITLVRNGQKVMTESIVNGGSIAKIAQAAKTNDIYRIQVNQIFRILEDGTLGVFSKGTATTDYWFYDVESLTSN